MEKMAKAIVRRIIDDLTDRSGLRQAWEDIDKDVRREITRAWVKIVEDEAAPDDAG